jgi:hypothetical protein
MNDQSARSAANRSNGTDELTRDLENENAAYKVQLENLLLIVQSCPACKTVAEHIGPILGSMSLPTAQELRADRPASGAELAIVVREAHGDLASVLAAIPVPREASEDERVSLWAHAVSALAATERLLNRLQSGGAEKQPAT